MATIMDKVQDWDAFAKAMHEAEDSYTKEWNKNGEPTHVGFTREWCSEHKFCEELTKNFGDWYDGICTGVMKTYLEDPYKFGCTEIADSLACLECGCRNYSLCTFIDNMFEDGKEFLQYCIDYNRQ